MHDSTVIPNNFVTRCQLKIALVQASFIDFTITELSRANAITFGGLMESDEWVRECPMASRTGITVDNG